MKRELIAGDERPHSTLLCAEHLSSKLERLDELWALRLRLQSVGVTRFRIVIVLRRQLELAVSRFTTTLRAGLVLDDPLASAPAKSALFLHAIVLERWRSVFCANALHVHPYAEGADPDESLRQIWAACDLPGDLTDRFDTDTDRPGALNRSLSPVAQQALILFDARHAGGADPKTRDVAPALTASRSRASC